MHKELNCNFLVETYVIWKTIKCSSTGRYICDPDVEKLERPPQKGKKLEL